MARIGQKTSIGGKCRLPVIGIDASRANARLRTGTEWYAFQVIQELKKVIPGSFQVVLYSKEALRDGLEGLPPNWESRVLRWPPGKFWTQIRLSWEMWRRPPDVLFVPAHALPLLLPPLVATTVHDVAFMVRPGAYKLGERLYHRWSARHAAARAGLLLTVSEFSKAETVKYFGADPDKIAVTPLGYDRRLYQPVGDRPALEDALRRYNIKEPYFLFVGRLEDKKNLAGLLRSFAVFSDRFDAGRGFRLVLVGKRGVGYERAWTGLGADVRRRVVETGYVCAEDSKYIYGGAAALVFPSWYEGFGLPLLEAFACGTPVIASRLASIPEVGGDAVRYVDPADPEDIAAAMDLVSRDEAARAALVAGGSRRVRGFSWEKTADLTWSALRRLAGGRCD